MPAMLKRTERRTETIGRADGRANEGCFRTGSIQWLSRRFKDLERFGELRGGGLNPEPRFPERPLPTLTPAPKSLPYVRNAIHTHQQRAGHCSRENPGTAQSPHRRQTGFSNRRDFNQSIPRQEKRHVGGAYEHSPKGNTQLHCRGNERRHRTGSL